MITWPLSAGCGVRLTILSPRGEVLADRVECYLAGLANTNTDTLLGLYENDVFQGISADGRIVWSRHLPGYSLVATDDFFHAQMIYLRGIQKCEIIGISPEDGNIIARRTFAETPCVGVSAAPDGAIAVIDEDGNLSLADASLSAVRSLALPPSQDGAGAKLTNPIPLALPNGGAVVYYNDPSGLDHSGAIQYISPKPELTSTVQMGEQYYHYFPVGVYADQYVVSRSDGGILITDLAGKTPQNALAQRAEGVRLLEDGRLALFSSQQASLISPEGLVTNTYQAASGQFWRDIIPLSDGKLVAVLCNSDLCSPYDDPFQIALLGSNGDFFEIIDQAHYPFALVGQDGSSYYFKGDSSIFALQLDQGK